MRTHGRDSRRTDFANAHSRTVITTYFIQGPAQIPYVVPFCPLPCLPETNSNNLSSPPLVHHPYQPSATVSPLTTSCNCGQCAQQQQVYYAASYESPPPPPQNNTLIVNRYTEINYFDQINGHLQNGGGVYADKLIPYDMVSV